tara:strand:+ start:210 stop:590 length:381 start_codon:yes stop_codon:yes gene_type:complete
MELFPLFFLVVVWALRAGASAHTDRFHGPGSLFAASFSAAIVGGLVFALASALARGGGPLAAELVIAHLDHSGSLISFQAASGLTAGLLGFVLVLWSRWRTRHADQGRQARFVIPPAGFRPSQPAG